MRPSSSARVLGISTLTIMAGRELERLENEARVSRRYSCFESGAGSGVSVGSDGCQIPSSAPHLMLPCRLLVCGIRAHEMSRAPLEPNAEQADLRTGRREEAQTQRQGPHPPRRSPS